MNGKALAVLNPGSLVAWLLINNSYFKQAMSLFLEAKVKQNTKIKPKITYLTWVIAFLAAENENRQLEDLPQADFGRVHKNVSFVDKEKVNNWFCEKKVTPIVFFCNGSTHFSS